MKQLKIILCLIVISVLLPLKVYSQNEPICQAYQGKNALARAEDYINQGKFKEAANIYNCYLRVHTDDKDVYIDYAESERFLENYSYEMSILNSYYNRFGSNKEYLMTKARLYADAGFYESALKINEPLLQKYPSDSYIIATQASTLYQSGHYTASLAALNNLTKKDPSSDDINYLRDFILTPHETNISLGYRFFDYAESTTPFDFPTSGQYIHQNDSVSISRIPILLQHYLSANSSLLLRGQYEVLSASTDSDSDTIDGNSSIHDSEFYIGLDYLITPSLDVRAYIGDLDISNGKNYVVYDLASRLVLNERWKVYLQVLHELFRPTDLTNGSPRSVSLGILETGGRGHINFKSSLQSTINLDLRASSLSDGNNYRRLAFEPGMVLYNSDKVNLSLGLNAELLNFHTQNLNDGYYSPTFYQLYELVWLFNIQPNPSALIQFYAGGGITRDENSSGMGLATDLGLEMKYMIYKNLDLVTEIDYLSRSLAPFYDEYDVSVGLTWRI